MMSIWMKMKKMMRHTHLGGMGREGGGGSQPLYKQAGPLTPTMYWVESEWGGGWGGAALTTTSMGPQQHHHPSSKCGPCVGLGCSGVRGVVRLLELLQRLLRGVLPQHHVLILQLWDALHQLGDLLLQHLHLLTHSEHQVRLDQVLQFDTWMSTLHTNLLTNINSKLKLHLILFYLFLASTTYLY